MAIKQEQAREIFRPIRPEYSKGELSNYFPKESLFDKTKQYVDEGVQKEVECDWMKINVSGVAIVLHKGKAVTKKELKSFNDAAKKYYLKGKKEPKES
jgi:hypothetical protein